MNDDVNVVRQEVQTVSSKIGPNNRFSLMYTQLASSLIETFEQKEIELLEDLDKINNELEHHFNKLLQISQSELGTTDKAIAYNEYLDINYKQYKQYDRLISKSGKFLNEEDTRKLVAKLSISSETKENFLSENIKREGPC